MAHPVATKGFLQECGMVRNGRNRTRSNLAITLKDAFEFCVPMKLQLKQFCYHVDTHQHVGDSDNALKLVTLHLGLSYRHWNYILLSPSHTWLWCNSSHSSLITHGARLSPESHITFHNFQGWYVALLPDPTPAFGHMVGGDSYLYTNAASVSLLLAWADKLYQEQQTSRLPECLLLWDLIWYSAVASTPCGKLLLNGSVPFFSPCEPTHPFPFPLMHNLTPKDIAGSDVIKPEVSCC